MPVVTLSSLGAVVTQNEVVTAGNDYAWTLTVTKDGATYNVTSATITATVRPEGESAAVTTGASVTITNASAGTLTFTVTDTTTATWRQPPPDKPNQAVWHFLDVKIVESGGAITNCGPLRFPVRRAVT